MKVYFQDQVNILKSVISFLEIRNTHIQPHAASIQTT